MLVLLPLEVVSGLMTRLSLLMVTSLRLRPGEDAPEMLKVITDPITRLVIQVDDLPFNPSTNQRLSNRSLATVTGHIRSVKFLVMLEND